MGCGSSISRLSRRRCGEPGSSGLELEDLLDSHPEGASDEHREGERRYVTTLLQDDDRLARAADAVGEFLLGHFVVLEAKPADLILDFGFRHSYLGSLELDGVSGQLAVAEMQLIPLEPLSGDAVPTGISE